MEDLHRLEALLAGLDDAALHQAAGLVNRELDRRRRAALMDFSEGDRVFFRSERGHVHGKVLRVNAKTVTVCGGDGTHWRVSPTLLEPDAAVAPPRGGHTPTKRRRDHRMR